MNAQKEVRKLIEGPDRLTIEKQADKIRKAIKPNTAHKWDEPLREAYEEMVSECNRLQFNSHVVAYEITTNPTDENKARYTDLQHSFKKADHIRGTVARLLVQSNALNFPF